MKPKKPRYRHPATNGIFWIRNVFKKKKTLCVPIPYFFMEKNKTWNTKKLYLSYEDSLEKHGIDTKMIFLSKEKFENSVERRIKKIELFYRKNPLFYIRVPKKFSDKLGWKNKASVIIRPNRHDEKIYLDFQKLSDLKKTVKKMKKLGSFKRRYSAHSWSFRQHHVVLPIEVMDEIDEKWWKRKKRPWVKNLVKNTV